MPKQVTDIRDIEGYEKLYLSPHIDDVVFSCPASLISDHMAKTSVLVVTVFGQYPNVIAQQKRRQEESVASHKGGYDFILGEFCDAPCRDPRLRNFRGIFGEMASRDHALIDNVSIWLKDIIDRSNPRTILAPLGVGRHIDHRLVHTAVKNILHKSLDVWWYEDRPYAFADSATELRLRELGYHANVDLVAFLEGSLAMPYAKDINNKPVFRSAYCNMHKKLVEEMMTSKLLPRYRLQTFDDFNKLWNLITSYRSQIIDIVGNSYIYESLAKKLAEKLNDKSSYVERQWQLQLV